MAGLRDAHPAIRARHADVAVIGSGRPEAIAGLRQITGFDGPVFTDPSLRAFAEAGLARGWLNTLNPISVAMGVAAMGRGFRQGEQQGDAIQQGGTFVLGPGPRVTFEWRDRFAGDHPRIADVLAALDRPGGSLS